MNYRRIYEEIIQKRVSSPYDGEYKEHHHIKPKFQGGGNEKENIVCLSPQEHFICHLLLLKIHKGTSYEAAAAGSLSYFFVSIEGCSYRNEQVQKGFLNNKNYLWARKNINKVLSERMKGKICVKTLDGELIGLVSVDHPKVVNGTWVHHSKGRIQPEYRVQQLKDQAQGSRNPNYKDYTPEVEKDIFDAIERKHKEQGFFKLGDFDFIIKEALVPKHFKSISAAFIRNRFNSVFEYLKYVETKLGYEIKLKSGTTAGQKHVRNKEKHGN